MRYTRFQQITVAVAGCFLLSLAAILPSRADLAAGQLPREIATTAACETAMARFDDDSAELRALRKLFKKNLHLRGTAHNPFPHWDADYSDFQKVFAQLTPADIPAVVYLLREGGINGGMRSIGVGVLRMFGPPALPCIEAALRKRGIEGYVDLSGARMGIQSDSATPSR